MDSGAWRAIVHVVAKSQMTVAKSQMMSEQLTLSLHFSLRTARKLGGDQSEICNYLSGKKKL